MNQLCRTSINFLKLFISFYIFIYCFPFPASYIPYGYEFFSKYVEALKAKFTLFFGREILGFIDLKYIAMNGSGDTTVDYIALISYATLGFLVALILYFFVRKHDHINRLYNWMIIYARYFVGLTLISYGVVKFLQGQFPSMSLIALESTYGESSPMGLAWRFFGYSDLYKGFMGVSEILAGFLLLFRRTAILGALVSIAVCTNIFIVNLAFDVPVKLFSGHLLFFSILILLPSLKALFGFFILHQQVRIKPTLYFFNTKWKKGAYIAAKIILVGLIPLSLAVGHVRSQSFRTFLNEWEGVYEVISFEIENKPDLSESAHWDKIFIQGKTIMTLNKAKTKNYYTIEHIWNEGEINFIESQEQEDPHRFILTELEDGNYKIHGEISTNKYQITAKRKLKKDYLLMNRGFHWVNELPFNR